MLILGYIPLNLIGYRSTIIIGLDLYIGYNDMHTSLCSSAQCSVNAVLHSLSFLIIQASL